MVCGSVRGLGLRRVCNICDEIAFHMGSVPCTVKNTCVRRARICIVEPHGSMFGSVHKEDMYLHLETSLSLDIRVSKSHGTLLLIDFNP
jgi:hypothetical protein